jgi:hypothetical protein
MMDYQTYLGQQPQPLPPQAYDAPPGAFPPPVSPVRPLGNLPQVGTPGGFGPFILRLANQVRRYGQLARQNGAR